MLKLTGDLETRTTQLLEWAAVGVGVEGTLRLLPLRVHSQACRGPGRLWFRGVKEQEEEQYSE